MDRVADSLAEQTKGGQLDKTQCTTSSKQGTTAVPAPPPLVPTLHRKSFCQKKSHCKKPEYILHLVSFFYLFPKVGCGIVPRVTGHYQKKILEVPEFSRTMP
jgi:hypothetical protein